MKITELLKALDEKYPLGKHHKFEVYNDCSGSISKWCGDERVDIAFWSDRDEMELKIDKLLEELKSENKKWEI